MCHFHYELLSWSGGPQKTTMIYSNWTNGFLIYDLQVRTLTESIIFSDAFFGFPHSGGLGRARRVLQVGSHFSREKERPKLHLFGSQA